MKTIRPNSVYAWLLASRPKTLTAALIPVMLGSGLAFSDGKFQTAEAVLCLLFACLMQVAANFINDLFDYQKGTDREDRLGPKRACAEGWISPRNMKLGIGVTLLLACLCGLSVVYLTWNELPQGGWELVVLGVVCLLFAFLYTTLLSYRGWGDLLVLVFFGLVPVGGTYYVQTGVLNVDVLVLSLVLGLGVIIAVMVVFCQRVPDGEKFLAESLAFLFGKETMGPSGMVPYLVLAGVVLCLLVAGVCILVTHRLTGRITATLKTLRRAADNLRDGELVEEIALDKVTASYSFVLYG